MAGYSFQQTQLRSPFLIVNQSGPAGQINKSKITFRNAFIVDLFALVNETLACHLNLSHPKTHICILLF